MSDHFGALCIKGLKISIKSLRVEMNKRKNDIENLNSRRSSLPNELIYAENNDFSTEDIKEKE